MKNTDARAVITVGDIDGVTIVQRPDGKIAAVSSLFTFDKQSGLAKTSKPDGSTLESWQCRLVLDATNTVVGWAWPAVLQADLPAPDVVEADVAGVGKGRAYSAAIPKFWDVPVSDLAGNVTHYGASVKLPDGNYVEVTDLNGNFSYYLLAL